MYPGEPGAVEDPVLVPVVAELGEVAGQLVVGAVGLLGAQFVVVPPVPVEPDVGEPEDGAVC
jgi:hypothetical protein